MKFSQVMAMVDVDQLPRLAQHAEEVGFEQMTLGDHLIDFTKTNETYAYSKDGSKPWYPDTHWPDPWVMFAALSQITNKIRFMTTIYVIPIRNPFSVAKAISTAARVSNNRVVLGAGVGWQKNEFDLMGQDFETRGKRTDEILPLLQALLSGQPVEHHGRYFDFPELQMSPGVTQKVPFLIGGKTLPALKRAALFDGWIGATHSLEELSEFIPTLKRERAALGKPNEPFEIQTSLFDYSFECIQRAEDLGVTHINRSPWFDEGRRASRMSLDEKLRDMEMFAERCMR